FRNVSTNTRKIERAFSSEIKIFPVPATIRNGESDRFKDFTDDSNGNEGERERGREGVERQARVVDGNCELMISEKGRASTAWRCCYYWNETDGRKTEWRERERRRVVCRTSAGLVSAAAGGQTGCPDSTEVKASFIYVEKTREGKKKKETDIRLSDRVERRRRRSGENSNQRGFSRSEPQASGTRDDSRLAAITSTVTVSYENNCGLLSFKTLELRPFNEPQLRRGVANRGSVGVSRVISPIGARRKKRRDIFLSDIAWIPVGVSGRYKNASITVVEALIEPLVPTRRSRVRSCHASQRRIVSFVSPGVVDEAAGSESFERRLATTLLLSRESVSRVPSESSSDKSRLNSNARRLFHPPDIFSNKHLPPPTAR
ncbi:hypothetical protein V1478_006656, partial [Vespula squamosa]